MKFLKLFGIILVCWLSWGSIALAAVNLPEKTIEARSDEPVVRVPDWEQISFADFPAMQEQGSVSLEGLGEDLTWSAGTKIAEILNLETISDLSPEKLSVHAIADKIGLPKNQATEILLGKFPLVPKQTFNDLLDGVIGLKNIPLGEFSPVADFLVKGDVPVLDTLLGAEGSPYNKLQSLAEDLGIRNLRDLNLRELESKILTSLDSIPVAEAVELLNLGELELSDLERIATRLGVEDFSIGDYSLKDIPGLVDSPIESLANWSWEKITDIPLLEDLPLSLMPNPMDILGGFVARVDMVWGESEGLASRTVSGGNEVGFEMPCEEKPCGAIELDDITSLGRQLQMEFEGKRWVAGDSQKVEGGKNCLKFVNGGKEPTGRHLFGSSFKVVAWNPDETGTQNIDFVAFFRFCFPCGPFGPTGCTPYFIGPIPLMGGFSQNDYVLLGKLDGEGGQTSPLPRQDIPIPEPATVESSPNRTPTNPCQGNVVPPSSLNSVLSDVVATLENNGNPVAIGAYGCDNGNCGRELGLYSLHSTDEKVRERIKSYEGGKEWLKKVDDGEEVTKSEVEQYFPPDDQDSVFRELVKHSVTNFNKSGSEVDEVSNFFDDWLGGEAADNDIFEQLSSDLLEVAKEESKRRGCNLSDLDLGKCGELLVGQAVTIDGNTVTNPASQALPLILKEALAARLSQAQVAYVLASAQHESVMGVHLEEIPEGDPVAYFNQKYSHRTDLGNQGGNDGYNYRGRGYVQITGRLNYQRYTDLSEELFGKHIDFIANPDRVAEPEIAAKILVHGMKNGTFTGVGLDRYINENKTDFYNARRIVNGTDRANLIASYSRKFDTVLNECVESGEATGRWIHPAPGYKVNSGYGPRAGCSVCSSNHKGVDFPTPTGTSIFASDGGTVFRASPADGYGNTVIIHHPNGLYTLYAHLSSFNVTAGQKVAQGDVIGQSGNTGNSTGPHLHFEFINDGPNPFRNSRINPTKFIDFS